MQAMILAAGFGSRLQPFTSLKPKPLFPLLNTPLLLLSIRLLQAAGCERILVNCHHLREQIVAAVADMPGVVILEEKTILGTGGGLRNALSLMNDEPLLVTNGDIYHNVDLKAIYNSHYSSGAAVTLAVHDYPRFNRLSVDCGRLVGFDGGAARDSVAFTGLHVINPGILESIASCRQSCIIDRYRTLLATGGEIAITRVDGAFWTDLGTTEDYLALHGDLLRKRVPCWEELKLRTVSPFLIDTAAVAGEGLQLQDWACVGRAHIGKNVQVSRSVIWDGAVIADNSIIRDSLIV